MTRWVEWVEPFIDSDPVYSRISAETAIKAQKASAKTIGFEYITDQDALDDFVICHWASIREEEEKMNKQYVNPNCGCPHPEEEHDGCAAGPYCNHKDCRCVDGTYYGKRGDPKSLEKVRAELAPEPDTPTRNSEVLKDFTAYCQRYPDLRFWQALRNWSGRAFIIFSSVAPCFIETAEDVVSANLHDTFYMEGKNG